MPRAGNSKRVVDALGNMKSLAPLVLKHEELVCGIEFSPDGKRVATGSFDGCVRVWEAGTGKLVTELAPGADYIFHVTFSPSGKHLIALNDGGQAILWETKNWQRLGSVSKPANSTNPVQPANYEPACPAWFPNGKRFAVGGGNELTVYDV